MAIISPFRALRPTPELAAKLASRPYDVLNSAEAREEVKDNSYSFLHITKSEVDLPEDTDTHSQQAAMIRQSKTWMRLSVKTFFSGNRSPVIISTGLL